MKGRAIIYSAAQMDWLEANRLLPIADYFDGFHDAFGRDDVTAANLHSLRKRKGWKTGRKGFFEPGQPAWNKGIACPPGTGGRHPNARATQFQPGVRQGVAERLYKPVGTTRIAKDGYIERKIHDGMPLQSRWRAVHLINWEAVNGPLPAGHALKCLDGDKSNVAPANWECIPRAVLARLNGGRWKQRLAYDAAPNELRPAILNAAKLAHKAREARQGKEVVS